MLVEAGVELVAQLREVVDKIDKSGELSTQIIMVYIGFVDLSPDCLSKALSKSLSNPQFYRPMA